MQHHGLRQGKCPAGIDLYTPPPPNPPFYLLDRTFIYSGVILGLCGHEESFCVMVNKMLNEKSGKMFAFLREVTCGFAA
jgi:hypothetical protein